MSAVAIIIDANGQTAVHNPACERFAADLGMAQGPAGVFANFDQMAESFDSMDDFIGVEFCQCLKEDRDAGTRNGACPANGRDGSRSSRNGKSARRDEREQSAGTPARTGSARGSAPRGAAGELSKAERFAQDAIDAGWSAEVISSEGNVFTAVATRGDEEIRISWRGEACLDGSKHKIGSHARTLRNAAACRRQLLVPAGQAKAPAVQRPVRRATAKLAPSSRNVVDLEELDEEGQEEEEARIRASWDEMRKSLPFQPTSEPAEILRAVAGREICWESRLTRKLVSATVLNDVGQRQFRIEQNSKGERILTFAAAHEGFRSVYLDSIVSVG